MTAREQYACRMHLADAAAAAGGLGVSDDPGSCDPTTEDCSAGSTPVGQDKSTGASALDGTGPNTSNPGHKPSQGSNSEGFYDQHLAPLSGGGSGGGGGFGGASGSGSVPSSGGSSASPGGGPASANLTEALTRAGIDPSMHPLISGFAAAEGNNPSGAPTLGFTDSQAGTTLDDHAAALAKQLQDRQSVAGPFKPTATPAEQASWMATVVGQNGVASDWQGNAQPARDDYVNRIVQNMPTAPPVTAAPPTQQPVQQQR